MFIIRVATSHSTSGPFTQSVGSVRVYSYRALALAAMLSLQSQVNGFCTYSSVSIAANALCEQVIIVALGALTNFMVLP